jgi:TonB family protein
MLKSHLVHTGRKLGGARIVWFQAAALALALAVTIPARAGDDRAVKSRVAPIYPELAKRMRITGLVKVEASVDADGKVTAVKTVSGNHSLSSAAEDAVSKWRFVPGSGPSTVDVDVNFTLGQ